MNSLFDAGRFGLGSLTATITECKSEESTITIHDNDLWAFLSIVAGEDSSVALRPEFNPSVGLFYQVDGVEVPAIRMRRLAEKGLLELNGGATFGACSKCSSLNLTATFRCPSCKEQSLSKTDLVVHYDCGHLAPVSEVFQEGVREYRCPSCHKEMKRVGIDYGRPGFGFICLSCRAVSQFPLLMMTCDKGHESKISEEEMILYPVYKVGPALRSMPRIMNVLTEIKDELVRNDVKCFALAQTKNQNGSELYISPILVATIPPITVDFILEDTAREFQVLQTIRKCADLNFRGLLVVKRAMYDLVKDMVNPTRITVIAFDDEADIARLTIQQLLELRSQKGKSTPLAR